MSCKLIITILCGLLEFQSGSLIQDDVCPLRIPKGEGLHQFRHCFIYVFTTDYSHLWGCAFLRVPHFIFLYLQWGNVCGDCMKQRIKLWKLKIMDSVRLSFWKKTLGWSPVYIWIVTVEEVCVKPAAAINCFTSECAWNRSVILVGCQYK